MSDYPIGDALFNDVDWHSVQQNQKDRMNGEIAGMDGNRLLNTAVGDLADYFTEKYRVDPPILDEEGIHVDQREVQMDVSRDQNRFISDRSRPFTVAATAVDVTIPFSGDAELFKVQPTTYTSMPPRGRVNRDHLLISFHGTNLEPERLRQSIDRQIQSISSYLETLRGNAEGLNNELPRLANEQIEYRRKKLLGDQSLVASLGFPMKTRADASRTYSAPEVRRSIQPKMPAASTVPYKPEPVLTGEDYEHILSVINNMVQVMERSPSAFLSIDEEALRSHFLVQLNGHYEGQATGETFNYEGKTDILIRADGRNIFIAECKYWGGPKVLTETIDQILGYATWRDTKLAIIIFNRNKNLTGVLEAIPETVAAHASFKRDMGQTSETAFRYVIGHRDDPNREMILSVLVFDVPT
ncbi:hypothetical protein ACXYMP_05670 [Aliiroseovarius sp. CAU 1755]